MSAWPQAHVLRQNDKQIIGSDNNRMATFAVESQTGKIQMAQYQRMFFFFFLTYQDWHQKSRWGGLKMNTAQ